MIVAFVEKSRIRIPAYPDGMGEDGSTNAIVLYVIAGCSTVSLIRELRAVANFIAT